MFRTRLRLAGIGEEKKLFVHIGEIEDPQYNFLDKVRPLKDSPFDRTIQFTTGDALKMDTDNPAGFAVGRLDEAFSALKQHQYSGVVGVLHANEEVYSSFATAAHLDIAPSSIQVDLLSITKTVTAVMVLKLIEDGRVRLSDTLAFFFDRVPADKSDITIHQLLTHSAGFQGEFGRDHEAIAKEEFLRRALSSNLLFSPGESYAYSNAGYSLLAAIVETCAKKPYETFLRTELLPRRDELMVGYEGVFDPRYSFRTAGGIDVAGASWGHDRPYWNLVGNGGLVSTARDMLSFYKRLIAGEIISLETLAKMQTPHVLEVPDSTHYGYGLVVEDSPDCGRVYWHNGGSAHFSSNWSHYADHTFVNIPILGSV